MKPKRLTERMFWQTWPQVAGEFPPLEDTYDYGDEYAGLRADGHCPITAVATRLGMEIGGADCAYDAFPDRSLPRWAEEVMTVADFGAKENPRVARRLRAAMGQESAK